MNIKSITAFGLVAVALAAISITPAEANNNSKYLNQMAMQMYMQNQAAASVMPSYLNRVVTSNYAYPTYTANVPYVTTPAVTPYVAYNNVVVPRYVRHEGFRRFWR